jgi:hypothetical protein
MFLSKRSCTLGTTKKINFSSRLNVHPPMKKSYVLSEDIKKAIDDVQVSIQKGDTLEVISKWDIVYELWNHYQRQEDLKRYEKKDVLDEFCDQDFNGSLECREYDL